MVQFNLHLPFPALLFVALVQANCVGQEFQNTLKPRVVFERDLKIPPLGAGATLLTPAVPSGILTRLGTELLLNDPANSQIIVVDTKNFTETKIPLDFRAIDLQTDAETDMLFLEILAPSDELWISDQVCYEKLVALKNQQPRWKFGSLSLYQQIRWLKEHQRFIVFSQHETVVLLDQNGVKLAEQKIEGFILGVDETEEGFNIFVLVRNQLELIPLDADFKVGKFRKLANVNRNILGGGLDISRNFRLRGLKSGEVTKYFLSIATQPGYLNLNALLPNGDYYSRLSFANKLSAAESLQPEIIVGLRNHQGQHTGHGFFLLDQQSNYFYEPIQRLTDAIFEERKLIVTRQQSKKSHHWTVRLISFESSAER